MSFQVSQLSWDIQTRKQESDQMSNQTLTVKLDKLPFSVKYTLQILQKVSNLTIICFFVCFDLAPVPYPASHTPASAQTLHRLLPLLPLPFFCVHHFISSPVNGRNMMIQVKQNCPCKGQRKFVLVRNRIFLTKNYPTERICRKFA